MKSVAHHITSLDVFRGLAVAAMIVVNNPGNWNAVHPQLVHAHWNGWTFADFVFPCFVFIVGVGLPFAFARRRESADRTQMLAAVAMRCATLVVLGLLLNLADALPHRAAIRVPGVLQRIGLAYAIAAPIVLLTGAVGWVAAAAGLLAAHTGLLLLVPFDGQAAGTMTLAHNLPGFVDRRIFGTHMLTPSSDPEGIVGTLSTAVTMLCGAMAGAWLRASPDAIRRVSGLAAGGALALAIGLAWSSWLPLNKSLWTGSFALASTGLAAVVFAACYAVVDVRGIRAWATPFVWLGVNPLAIYFLSELSRHLLDIGWIADGPSRVGLKDALFWRYLSRIGDGDFGGVRSSLVFALGFTAIWTCVAGLLYRRGVRLRV